MKNLVIVVTTKKAEAEHYKNLGYCPVECSIEGESVVDSTLMDHHGKFSSLEGVAIRAYRDLYGHRKSDPRFVTAFPGDADAMFAIAALAGLLPHPSNDVPAHLSFLKTDLTGLASVINTIDTDPIGRDIRDSGEALLLKVWTDLSGFINTELAAQGAVQLWVNLTTTPDFKLEPYKNAAEMAESRRLIQAQMDLNERSAEGFLAPPVGLILDAKVWGFDEWYRRLDLSLPPHKASSWLRPVVLARISPSSELTIGCPNPEVAAELFGFGGLKNVFPVLDRIIPGWGGREAIGGSPRGADLTYDQCVQVATQVRQMIENRQMVRDGLTLQSSDAEFDDQVARLNPDVGRMMGKDDPMPT